MGTGLATWEAQGVSVGAIESELNRLWSRDQSEWVGSGRRPDIRTSVLNLIIYARDEVTLERADDVIDHLSGTHPSRSLIIVPLEPDGTGSIDARVSIKSHGAYAELGQVCSEELVLWVHGATAQHLDSVVIPLMAPDLPAFIWWPGESPFHHPLFYQLRDAANRFIVDSDDFPHQEHNLADMAHGVRASRAKCAFSDFNWARLAPLRHAIASFFDSPENLRHLDRLASINIGYSTAPAGNALSLCRALLLGGWLASSLGMKPEERETKGEREIFHLDRSGQKIVLEIAPGSESPGKAQGLISLVATNDDEAVAEFSIVQRPRHQLTATVSLKGKAATSRRLMLDPLEEGALLFQELEVFYHDPSFEGALEAAAKLLQPKAHAQPARGSLLV